MQQWQQWQKCIAAGKENGEMLIDSIKNGRVKHLPEITAKDKDGVTDILASNKPDSPADHSILEEVYDMTVTSKLSIYFYLDCQLTFTLSSITTRLQKKYEIASKNLWKAQR
ncbi:hypothetical protein Tco_0200917 [Tanacetum coccineum]